jgi:hypothetical protein
MIDFSKEESEAVRIGACYEMIKNVLKKFWGVELPEDSGRDALPPSESLSKLVEKSRAMES